MGSTKMPEVSKQTVNGTWEKADEIPYYPNVCEWMWNWMKSMFTRRKKNVWANKQKEDH